ncbi:cytochrome C biogenesis protein [Nitrobacter sp. 62-13]|uniref:tetratricopeptide repeat protein n=1 Tax=Nitrobacter sp. 62-13 TaxID=1895797 RepID=UPI00344D6D4D
MIRQLISVGAVAVVSRPLLLIAAHRFYGLYKHTFEVHVIRAEFDLFAAWGMTEALTNQKHRSRSWSKLYIASSVAGVAIGVAAAVWFTHLPPLTTHHVTVSLNSAATAPPVPLEGLSDLPKMIAAKDASQSWAIAGGALLQVGLARFSVPMLERAIENDPDNSVFHVALGEALALADKGLISDRAKAEFELVLRNDPNDLIARFYMGLWLLQNGKAKPALVKWVGLMRTVGSDQTWNDRLWMVMPTAAEEVGINQLTLQALCASGM